MRLPVDEVRRLAIRAGFGRIHVQKCKRGSAEYCAKYLTKKDDGLKKGTRRWGMFGGFKGTRVKDIIVESDLAENCRQVSKVVKTWSHGLFVAINKLTVKYGHILEWPTFDEFKPLEKSARSDNDHPENASLSPRPVFKELRLYCSEIKEYVTHLIPVPVLQPF